MHEGARIYIFRRFLCARARVHLPISCPVFASFVRVYACVRGERARVADRVSHVRVHDWFITRQETDCRTALARLCFGVGEKRKSLAHSLSLSLSREKKRMKKGGSLCERADRRTARFRDSTTQLISFLLIRPALLSGYDLNGTYSD